MRYAMTGATGFLGRELARQLLASGHDVVALVRDPSRAKRAGTAQPRHRGRGGTDRPGRAGAADPAGPVGRGGQGGDGDLFGDSTKAVDELGWTTRPLREGMTATVRAELAPRGGASS
jgi:nucleoside-diphosphate-sugar epimerase